MKTLYLITIIIVMALGVVHSALSFKKFEGISSVVVF